MMANGNISSTVIPHDIKPGNYVLRHELIALHYATEDSLCHMKADKLLGPQVYLLLLEHVSTTVQQPDVLLKHRWTCLEEEIYSFSYAPLSLSRDILHCIYMSSKMR